MYPENKEIRNNFARNLKSIRKNAGLTQLQLAEKAGFKAPVITRYETGGALPRPEALAKLAAALNVNPNELIATQHTKYSGKLNVVLTIDVKSLPDAEMMINRILCGLPFVGKRSVNVEHYWIDSITKTTEAK